MDHYAFARDFRKVYDAAVARFAAGQRDAATLLTDEERKFVSANGLTVQNFLDYAEDHNGYGGEPGPEQALTIELVFYATQESVFLLKRRRLRAQVGDDWLMMLRMLDESPSLLARTLPPP